MQSAFQRIRFCFHGESLSFSEHSHSTGSAPFQQAAFSASRLVAPVAPSGNPNGIPTESPGLRGTRYPGSPSNKHPQPQRGCGPSHHTVARDVRHNPVGVDSNLSRSPKVGAAPTLGWWPQSLWDCSRPNAIRFLMPPHRPPDIPNRNAVASDNLLSHMQPKVVVGSGAVERAQLPAGVPEHFHPPPPRLVARSSGRQSAQTFPCRTLDSERAPETPRMIRLTSDATFYR